MPKERKLKKTPKHDVKYILIPFYMKLQEIN